MTNAKTSRPPSWLPLSSQSPTLNRKCPQSPRSLLRDFNVSATTVEGIKKISDAVYSDVAAMAMLRESKGTAEEDIPAPKAAEEKARKSMAAWFYGLGSRDPNKKDGKRRPCTA